MFCEKCGSELTEGARFCEKCGCPVVTKKKSSKAWILVIIIIVLLGTGVGVAAVLFVSGKGQSQSAQEESNAEASKIKDSKINDSKVEDSKGQNAEAGDSKGEDKEPEAVYSLTREEELKQISNALGAPYIGGKSYSTSLYHSGDDYRINTKSYGEPGFFGACRADYDMDGQDEYLVVSLGIGDTGDNLQFRFHMLEWDGKGWNLKAQTDIGIVSNEYAASMTPFCLDSFYKNINGQLVIFAEGTGYARYFADGETWALRQYTYDGTQFVMAAENMGLSGSDIMAWMDLDPSEAYSSSDASYVQDFKDKVLSSGITYQKIGYDTPALVQDAAAMPVGRCRKTDTITTEDASRLTQGDITTLDGISVAFSDYDQIERQQQNTHRYEIIISDTTWKKAWEDCISRGGYLARFETEEELQTLIQQISAQGLGDKVFYLGGKRKGESTDYYWYKANDTKVGEALNSSGSWIAPWWMAGEPSYEDSGVKENRMDMFYYKDEGRWVINDIPNDIIAAVSEYAGRVAYICEYDR